MIKKTKTKSANQDVDHAVEIERLAALDSTAYETTRADSAKRLKMRAAVLDKIVAKKRRQLGLEGDDDKDKGQGRAVKIADPLPWHEPVNGDHLATAIVCALRTYIAISESVADAVALWCIYTWSADAFHIAPRMAITSPTKGCGKTTLLALIGQLVRRSKRAGSISPAALFRVIEKFRPTILLDETEKYLEPDSDCHALLNEGHRKGGSVMRVLEPNFELREFDVFGPVAFCRNGWMPDDLAQRSIIIAMQRRTYDDQITEFREDRCDNLKTLARMACRWSDDHTEALRDADPDVGFINRDADNWRPLFAVADEIGSDWPERIRTAAAILTPRESDSIGPMLLEDVRAIFDEHQMERIGSQACCNKLSELESRPWAEYRNGKPITPTQLAKLLRPFGIAPDTLRVDGELLKGYPRHAFQDAWARYSTPYPPASRNTVTMPTAAGTSGTFQGVTSGNDVTAQECEKPLGGNGCYGVTAKKGGAPVCAQCGANGDALRLYNGILLHAECVRFYATEPGGEIPF